MMNQEAKRTLRKAIYKDVDVLYDFFSGNKEWEEDGFEEAKEAVPGITLEEYDEYRKEDGPVMAGIIKIAIKAATDESFRKLVFDTDIRKAYDAASPVAGSAVSFEDFKEAIEVGGEAFFKTFEGIHPDDELDLDELSEASGGISDDELQKIIKHLGKWFKGCFVGSSLVDTPSGARPICEIKPGDIVYSLDENNNKIEAKVTEAYNSEESIVEVLFDNGKKWETTPSQWFYSGNKFYSIWQNEGHDITTLDGTARVKNITETTRKEPVFDIVIDGKNIMFINGLAAEGFGE